MKRTGTRRGWFVAGIIIALGGITVGAVADTQVTVTVAAVPNVPKSVVVRARWEGHAPMDSTRMEGDIGTWTQGAGELDQILPGTITLKIDPGCVPGQIDVRLSVPGWNRPDGTPITVAYYVSSIARNTTTSPQTIAVPLTSDSDQGSNPRFPQPLVVFEPGTATHRTMHVSVGGRGGCPTGAEVLVLALSFDVVGTR